MVLVTTRLSADPTTTGTRLPVSSRTSRYQLTTIDCRRKCRFLVRKKFPLGSLRRGDEGVGVFGTEFSPTRLVDPPITLNRELIF